jgi:hypothetical protein
MAGKQGEVLFGKYWTPTHVFMHGDTRAIGDGNAGTFLTTMLQGVSTKKKVIRATSSSGRKYQKYRTHDVVYRRYTPRLLRRMPAYYNMDSAGISLLTTKLIHITWYNFAMKQKEL